jgi:hypothetical protein
MKVQVVLQTLKYQKTPPGDPDGVLMFNISWSFSLGDVVKSDKSYQIAL